MITDTRPSWDTLYMSMAYLMGYRSPDESTKVGSIITTEDHVVVAMGYNGLPRGMQLRPEVQERPKKYNYFEHGERNAIYNAARTGARMDLAHRIYIPWLPCSDCARAIIQTGIKEVVVHKAGQEAFEDSRDSHGWGESQETALEMFTECDVMFRWYTGPILAHIHGFYSGHKYGFVDSDFTRIR